MASNSSVKEEEMNENESIECVYNRLCLDLNMDVETKEDAWRSYEHIRKHYVLEGDQIHWLAVSLYVSCRRNRFLSTSDNNPISISRLLKSSNNFELIIFFDKLHKWEDMANLPSNIRNKIDQVEHAFNISSIIFQKYTNIFIQIFSGNDFKFLYQDYQLKRDINPKLIQKNKQKKCSHQDLYSLIWTIYALAKTIYPATSNDLIASFHLLIASFQFVYHNCRKAKLFYLLKGSCLDDVDEDIIDKLCVIYSCSSSMCRTIYFEHLTNELFNRFVNAEELLNEKNCFETIRDINRFYDEIVLTNCIIDERIFLENKIQLNDLLKELNENRYSKSIDNRTPLTANQHFINIHQQTNLNLTPISQANHLINILYQIIGQQQLKPSNALIRLIEPPTFLDDLIQRLNEWETKFINEYENIERINISYSSNNSSTLSKSRFDLSLKLFYTALQNILTIEEKRLKSKANSNDQETEKIIREQFHKLILNNDFLKSVLGLCQLLVLFAHSDKTHDFNWILSIYDLHGYSFLKIIQIYLNSSKELNQSRTFIKYLSSIEEFIISSLAFTNNSALWNDIKIKGFLSYQQIKNIKSKQNNSSTPPHHNSTNLTQMYLQSPNNNNVRRKLFSNTQQNNELSIVRSRSDPIVENSSISHRKSSPYTTFYNKLYVYVLSRIDVMCLRLYGSSSNQFSKIVWNLFLYLFENYTELLFRGRDLDQIILSTIYYSANSNLFKKDNLTWTKIIQAYKSMPNSKLKTVRSVFIKKINSDQTVYNTQTINENPCLTPSKPAGTKNIIDGNLFGDIDSFYKEIFLKISNIEENILNHFNKIDELIEIPIRNKSSNNQNVSIYIGENIFVDYSSNQIKSNLSLTNQLNHFNSNNNQNKNSNNILSSSIQAGAHNTVRTTRTRTEDGKFLTTISTISKGNNNEEKRILNTNETNLLFGQSSQNSIKRTLEDDHNSNCLTSLTKKVLQIENDRIKFKKN